MKQCKNKICLTIVILSAIFLNIGFNPMLAATETEVLTTETWSNLTGTGNFTKAYNNAYVISNNTGSEIEFIRNSSAPATYQSEHYICVDDSQELNVSSLSLIHI